MKLFTISSESILNTTNQILTELSNEHKHNISLHSKIVTSTTINKGCKFLYDKNLDSIFILNISLLIDKQTIIKLFETLNNPLFSSFTIYIIYSSNQRIVNGDIIEYLKNPMKTIKQPDYKEIKVILTTKFKNISKEKLEFITNKLTGLKEESIKTLLNSINNVNSIKLDKFNNFLSLFPTSNLKKASLLLPNISSENMAGYSGVISKILTSIKSNSNLCKGVLLEGPPGTGKTILTQRISYELNRKLIYQKSSQLLSCYLGESEERLRALFKEAKKLSPSILFFDEIDSLLSNRFDGSDINSFDKRLLATFLTEIDSIREHGDVIIFAATNRIECLDMAFLRKGRVDLQFHIGVFQGEHGMRDIKEIFKLHFNGLLLVDKGEHEVELNNILRYFIDKTASDIAAFCNKLKMYKLEKFLLNNKNKLKEVSLIELKDLINDGL